MSYKRYIYQYMIYISFHKFISIPIQTVQSKFQETFPHDLLHLWNSHTKSVIRVYKIHVEFRSKDYTSISVSSTSNPTYNLLVASVESSSNLLSPSFSDHHLTSYNFVYPSLPVSLYRLYLRLQTWFSSWIPSPLKSDFLFFSLFAKKYQRFTIRWCVY